MIAAFHRRIVAEWGAVFIFASFSCGVFAQTKSSDGRELFMDSRKGNCVACHRVPGDSPATGGVRVGPDLVGIKARYPDRAQLRAVIWDSTDKLPNTAMPPYGKHRILTEAEIDAVLRYVEML